MRSNGIRWPSAEDELLATCARLKFGETERWVVLELSRQHEINWRQIYSAAVMHGVAPLAYSNLSQFDPGELGLADGIVDRFRRRFAENLVAKQRLREGLWRILGFFNERDLDAMLIKGAAVNVFESKASRYTVSRDVDLLIRARQEEISWDLFAEIVEVSDGFPLEFDFYGHHDIDMNGAIKIDYDRIWADAIPIRYAGRNFYLMSPEDSFITACINACRKRYFNLKALYVIDSMLQDAHSYRLAELADKACDYGVNEIVCVALKATAAMTGRSTPPELAKHIQLRGMKDALSDLLIDRLSFSSLASLYGGLEIAGRKLGSSLLLPYISYRRDQAWRKIQQAMRTNGAG